LDVPELVPLRRGPAGDSLVEVLLQALPAGAVTVGIDDKIADLAMRCRMGFGTCDLYEFFATV
jgi:hypothetical protein